MGHMGFMMGGWQGGGWAGVWPVIPMLGMLVVVGCALIGLWVMGAGRGAQRRATLPPRSPQETLRQRYASGDLTAPQYREALVDLLKQRYVEGEIDLAEYETRLGRVLEAAPR